MQEVLKGPDVFLGVSKGGLLCADDIHEMNEGAIILVMANALSEILTDEAKAGGVALIGTGRSDFLNQVNTYWPSSASSAAPANLARNSGLGHSH